MSTVAERPAKASLAPPESAESRWPSARELLLCVMLGALFGIALVKSEAVSWFRIQEMIRFRGFHLFGVLGSAVITAAIGIRLLRQLGVRSMAGEPIVVPPKAWGSGTRYAAGGTIFGLGWTLTGSCPGPFYALLGAGVWTIVIPLLSAVGGAWVYGWMRGRLPH